jgi:hypothetical protein
LGKSGTKLILRKPALLLLVLLPWTSCAAPPAAGVQPDTAGPTPAALPPGRELAQTPVSTEAAVSWKSGKSGIKLMLRKPAAQLLLVLLP